MQLLSEIMEAHQQLHIGGYGYSWPVPDDDYDERDELIEIIWSNRMALAALDGSAGYWSACLWWSGIIGAYSHVGAFRWPFMSALRTYVIASHPDARARVAVPNGLLIAAALAAGARIERPTPYPVFLIQPATMAATISAATGADTPHHYAAIYKAKPAVWKS